MPDAVDLVNRYESARYWARRGYHRYWADPTADHEAAYHRGLGKVLAARDALLAHLDPGVSLVVGRKSYRLTAAGGLEVGPAAVAGVGA